MNVVAGACGGCELYNARSGDEIEGGKRIRLAGNNVGTEMKGIGSGWTSQTDASYRAYAWAVLSDIDLDFVRPKQYA